MYSENIYKAKATSWGWTETSGGKPQFWMGFDVIGVVDRNRLDAPPKPCDPGTGRWSITPTTDKSEDWLIRTVRELGYDRDDLLDLDPGREGAFNFEGVEFPAQLKHKEFNGQTREEWSVYSPRTKLPSDKLAALNERFGPKFKEAKERQKGKEVTATAKAMSATAAGKDEPF
jgi:hypothetical protein